MQVQMTIELAPDRCHFQLDIMSREDATDEERAVAVAVESFMAIAMERIAKDAGMTVNYIGAQRPAAASHNLMVPAATATPDDAAGGIATSDERNRI